MQRQFKDSAINFSTLVEEPDLEFRGGNRKPDLDASLFAT